MAAKKLEPMMVFLWLAVALMVGVLATALMLTSSLELVGKSSGEIMQVVQHLESIDSLKTILVTYSSQYQRAESHWMQVVNLLLFFLFVLAMLVVGLLVALRAQLRRSEAQQAQLRRLREG